MWLREAIVEKSRFLPTATLGFCKSDRSYLYRGLRKELEGLVAKSKNTRVRVCTGSRNPGCGKRFLRRLSPNVSNDPIDGGKRQNGQPEEHQVPEASCISHESECTPAPKRKKGRPVGAPERPLKWEVLLRTLNSTALPSFLQPSKRWYSILLRPLRE